MYLYMAAPLSAYYYCSKCYISLSISVFFNKKTHIIIMVRYLEGTSNVSV